MFGQRAAIFSSWCFLSSLNGGACALSLVFPFSIRPFLVLFSFFSVLVLFNLLKSLQLIVWFRVRFLPPLLLLSVPSLYLLLVLARLGLLHRPIRAVLGVLPLLGMNR